MFEMIYLIGLLTAFVVIATAGKAYGLVDIFGAVLIAALWPAIVLTLFLISFVIVVGSAITGLNVGQ